MIALSDTQLEVIMRAAAPLPEEICQEFLERVAAVLKVCRGQINDYDVAVAVDFALGTLIRNSTAWKNWNRLPKRQNGWGFDAALAGPLAVLTTWRAWHLLLAWRAKLQKCATQGFRGIAPVG
jgi:hypothetical protein